MFARSILTKLLKCTKYHLDLCFDVYESPSIKDVTLHLIPNNSYRPILKLFLHADRDNRRNIVVHANTTDIAVILVYKVKFTENSNTWYDFGIDSNNSREYLNVTKLHKSINYVSALPGLFAFTGNDYTPAFYRKGQIKPTTLM